MIDALCQQLFTVSSLDIKKIVAHEASRKPQCPVAHVKNTSKNPILSWIPPPHRIRKNNIETRAAHQPLNKKRPRCRFPIRALQPVRRKHNRLMVQGRSHCLASDPPSPSAEPQDKQQARNAIDKFCFINSNNVSDCVLAKLVIIACTSVCFWHSSSSWSHSSRQPKDSANSAMRFSFLGCILSIGWIPHLSTRKR